MVLVFLLDLKLKSNGEISIAFFYTKKLLYKDTGFTIIYNTKNIWDI